ncbi:MAG: MOSC N-terminal beta barrel domain-containing protein, partial [Alphaproteobacteria bacterium]
MTGALSAIYRYPVKGFSPEELSGVDIANGAGLPNDRVYAVEDGPSGFDPAAPAHISKMRFTVLAKLPEVALARTTFDDSTHVLRATAPGRAPISAPLAEEAGRNAFAAWLADFLGPAVRGPLRVLPAPSPHRFYDDEAGFISVINLASVRDLAAQLDRPVDPLRFRANLYVNDWPAWAELEATEVKIGGLHGDVIKPIRRCVATHVDPQTGVADIDLVPSLMRLYGHPFCGVYVRTENGGSLRPGDAARLI